MGLPRAYIMVTIWVSGCRAVKFLVRASPKSVPIFPLRLSLEDNMKLSVAVTVLASALAEAHCKNISLTLPSSCLY